MTISTRLEKINKTQRYVIVIRDIKGRTFEIDHVKPINKGGSNSFDNLVISCFTCNSKKWSHNKKPKFWMFRVNFKK